MLWLLYTYSVFDKYVKAELYPEILHKGFYSLNIEEETVENRSDFNKTAIGQSEKTKKEQADEPDKK